MRGLLYGNLVVLTADIVWSSVSMFVVMMLSLKQSFNLINARVKFQPSFICGLGNTLFSHARINDPRFGDFDRGHLWVE
jgi:hypothetical protein